MKTFQYALLIGITLACITPKSFAKDITPQDVAALEQKANQGDADAQFRLGIMYKMGLGVPQNYVKSVECFSKAANQGFSSAELKLGEMYNDGFGVPKDYVKAMEWFKKSADQGNYEAQYNLGLMYYKGQEVQQNYIKAVEWFNKAASSGSPLALMKLGIIYENGKKGISPDKIKAKEYYNKACFQEDWDGCNAYKRLNDE